MRTDVCRTPLPGATGNVHISCHWRRAEMPDADRSAQRAKPQQQTTHDTGMIFKVVTVHAALPAQDAVIAEADWKWRLCRENSLKTGGLSAARFVLICDAGEAPLDVRFMARAAARHFALERQDAPRPSHNLNVSFQARQNRCRTAWMGAKLPRRRGWRPAPTAFSRGILTESYRDKTFLSNLSRQIFYAMPLLRSRREQIIRRQRRQWGNRLIGWRGGRHNFLCKVRRRSSHFCC